MNNQQVAALFYEFADLLDILGVEWKPIAFRKAARNIETLEADVKTIYEKKGLAGLEEIPGVGKAIAEKTAEWLTTGRMKELEATRKKLPKGIVDLMKVRGVGPKTVKVLYKKLRIATIPQLEAAAKAGKIRKLEGFGEKSEQDMLEAIAFMRKGSERVSLGIALPLAREIEAALRKVKGVHDVMLGGSVRRRRETCKDIDVLVVADKAAPIMEAFTTLPNVVKITGKGDTKSGVLLAEGIPADLRVVPAKSFGAAVQYFSGSKEHNVHLRQLALKKGLTLNEYGLFTVKGKKYVCGRSEEEIYKRIGVPFVPPELRENSGEFGIKKIPRLIDYDALRGDLHMHTRHSDGTVTPEKMVEAAVAMGYEYIAITDHSVSEVQANGLDAKRLVKYLAEIRALQKKHDDIRIFVGSEVSIKPDGSLDYPDKLLKELDIVVASLHSSLTMEREKATKRVLRALSNDHVTIFGHPTGRVINGRPGIDFDTEKVFDAAKDNGVLLEINSQPRRLDLQDVLIRRAKDAGCRFIIDTDAHHPDHLRFAEYGIAMARRGWLEASDVANTLPLKKFEKLVGK